MASKYLKNSEGIVRAITSDNLQLEKPLLNENYDIEVHNRNMDKIDSAIQFGDYSKENNTDVLGLGNMIYKNYFKDYNKYKDKNIYEIANFKIEIDNKMYRYGNINKGAA